MSTIKEKIYINAEKPFILNDTDTILGDSLG